MFRTHRNESLNILNTMEQLLTDIRQIIADARRQVQRNINVAMVQSYWLIGKRIIEDEQAGKPRSICNRYTESY